MSVEYDLGLSHSLWICGVIVKSILLYVCNPTGISSKDCLSNLGFIPSKTLACLEDIQVSLGRIILYWTSLLHIMLFYVVYFISSNKAVDWNFLTVCLSPSSCHTSFLQTVYLQTARILLVPYELQDCSTAVLWSQCIFGFFRSLLCMSFGLIEL